MYPKPDSQTRNPQAAANNSASSSWPLLHCLSTLYVVRVSAPVQLIAYGGTSFSGVGGAVSSLFGNFFCSFPGNIRHALFQCWISNSALVTS
eukprot:1487313-Rhodomonas_salina.1